MGNDLLNPVTILKDSMVRLENSITMTKHVNRDLT